MTEAEIEREEIIRNAEAAYKCKEITADDLLMIRKVTAQYVEMERMTNELPQM